MDKNKRLDQNNEFSSQASVTAFFLSGDMVYLSPFPSH